MKNQTVDTLSAPQEERAAHLVSSEIYPYTAGIVGGLLGGLAMAVTALAYGRISGHGLWYPITELSKNNVHVGRSCAFSIT